MERAVLDARALTTAPKAKRRAAPRARLAGIVATAAMMGVATIAASAAPRIAFGETGATGDFAATPAASVQSFVSVSDSASAGAEPRASERAASMEEAPPQFPPDPRASPGTVSAHVESMRPLG